MPTRREIREAGELFHRIKDEHVKAYWNYQGEIAKKSKVTCDNLLEKHLGRKPHYR